MENATNFHVYILQSLSHPNRIYIGFTSLHPAKRVQEHNQPANKGYTFQHRPWRLVTYVVFEDKQQALNFETYCKTGSGFRMVKKHFLPPNKQAYLANS